MHFLQYIHQRFPEFRKRLQRHTNISSSAKIKPSQQKKSAPLCSRLQYFPIHPRKIRYLRATPCIFCNTSINLFRNSAFYSRGTPIFQAFSITSIINQHPSAAVCNISRFCELPHAFCAIHPLIFLGIPHFTREGHQYYI